MNTQPIQRFKNLEIYPCSVKSTMPLPLIAEGISAGFPSPAMDFEDIAIDLNRELIKNPATTFYGRVKGHSMRDAGIFNNDLLVIDRSLQVSNNKIAVCYVDGEFTIKRINIEKDCVWLIPENDSYKPIKVTSESELIIWGVIIHSIKSF
ncbi:MAG: LexA family transcriptional regulator [Crocinitomicaceae bacterium]|nr:LexA family transcriptional regulator [Crocinitomicaceae bacterium]